MKERIEKKLGCTIEECCDRMIRSFEDNQLETERKSPFSVLDADELDFVVAYIDKKR